MPRQSQCYDNVNERKQKMKSFGKKTGVGSKYFEQLDLAAIYYESDDAFFSHFPEGECSLLESGLHFGRGGLNYYFIVIFMGFGCFQTSWVESFHACFE